MYFRLPLTLEIIQQKHALPVFIPLFSIYMRKHFVLNRRSSKHYSISQELYSFRIPESAFVLQTW